MKDGTGIFDGEEEGAKDSVEAEDTEEKRGEFGEFDQRALEDFGWREFLGVLCADVMQEQRAIGGDPDILQAIPYAVGHGVLPHGSEEGGEGSIGSGLALDVFDHGFAVVAEKLFDEARGEASLGGRGLVERPDGKDELPGLLRLFPGEIIALPEGPEERAVLGRILRRRLESDPGLCQMGALAVGHDVTAGSGEFG